MDSDRAIRPYFAALIGRSAARLFTVGLALVPLGGACDVVGDDDRGANTNPGEPEPGDPEPGDPEPGDPEPGDPEPGDSSNACVHAYDSECDEPNYCAPGTDTADCQGDDDPNNEIPARAAGCPTIPVGVVSQGPLVFNCGAPGPIVVTMMQSINGFWGSQVQACACNADAASVCAGNAFVANAAPDLIYYDRDFLAQQVQKNGDNQIVAAWILAHEFGHVLQNAAGYNALSIQKELGADCLAGYFVSALFCTSSANESDYASVIQAACQLEDSVATPWYAQGAHGNCQQRMAAVQRGINGYAYQQSPWTTCVF